MKGNFLKKLLVGVMACMIFPSLTSCEEIFGQWENPVNDSPVNDPLVNDPPLTLEVVNEGETMNVTFESTLSKPITLQYSLDAGQNWSTLYIEAGQPGYTDKSSEKHDKKPSKIILSGIKQILFKAENESYGEFSSVGLDNPKEDVDRNLNISVDADCYIYGNIMSLVGGDKYFERTDLRKDMTFFYLFAGNANLKSHPTKKLLLPATKLTKKCYRQMFYGCSALTVAPDLPANELTERCYSGMFRSCFALTAIPVLPATTLAPYCYYEMFYGCKALTEVAELLATTAAEYSCSRMFVGCSALKTVSSRLASTVADHCYYYMFADCTALVTAPELPATTMEPYCYSAMFRGCPSLETAPALPATQLADHCYESMFFNYLNDPYQLKNAPELPATTLADNCYTYMFSGCKSLTTAPDLPAKVLENGCYVCMFNNCTSLTSVKCLATSIASDATTSPTHNWLRSVPTSGTFVKDASVDYGSGEFWDTTTQLATTTKCAAQDVAGWTWKNN